MTKIKEILEKVTNLPMLSNVASRLLMLVGDPDHSHKDVVSLVENDPTLTARILKVANSAALSRGNEITTLSRAVMQLGEKMIVGIAIGSCTDRVYNEPLDGYAGPKGILWDHSLLCGIASREVASFSKSEVSSDLAFTSGLLHDIGKSIISEFLKGNESVMTAWLDAGKVEDFLHAENEVIGTDHAKVGLELARHWSLPRPISECIELHHNPESASDENKNLVYIVHIGDIVAMLAGTGTGSDSLAYRMDEKYSDYLKITPGDIQKTILNCQQEFERTKNAIFAGGG